MGLASNIIYNKFQPQIRDYTTGLGTKSLKVNSGERLEVEIECETYWYSEPTDFEVYDDGARIVLKDSTNLIKDGFTEGDTIIIQFGYYNVSTAYTGLGTIINISEDGKMLFTNLTSIPNGRFTDDYNNPQYQMLITGVTSLNNIIYRYNYIDNDDESVDFTYILGDEQHYQIKNISNIETTGSAMGYKRWYDQDDFVKVTKLQDVSLPVIRGVNFGGLQGTVPDAVQRFLIKHRSTVPYYQVGELNNFQNNEIVDRLLGKKSYKYIFSSTFKKNIKDANDTKTVIFTGQKGSVGWFNENFNNFPSQYTFDSITYTDYTTNEVLDSLTLNNINNVSIIVNSADGSFDSNTMPVISHSILPTENIYTDNYRDKNYYYTSVIKGSGSLYLFNITTTIISPNQMQIDFQMDLTTATDLTANDYYYISVVLDDYSLNSENSDRVNLLCDVKQYTKNLDIFGLITNYQVDINTLLEYSNLSVPLNFTEIKGWVQDPIKYKISFNYDYDYIIDKCSVDVVAWNNITNKYFTLQSKEIFNKSNNYINPINGSNIVDSTKNVIKQTDGYSSIIANNDGTYIYSFSGIDNTINTINQNYIDFTNKLLLGWQDWIAVDGVDEIFINGLEPNSGLNNNWSNYSLKENYTIKILTNIDISNRYNGISTNYLLTSPCNILNFNEDILGWSLNSINCINNGNNIDDKYFIQDDMTIEISLYYIDDTFDINTLYGQIRIESEKNTNDNEVYIFSDTDVSLTPVTISNFYYNKVTKIKNGNELILRLSLSKEENQNIFKTNGKYNISGRISLTDNSIISLGEFSNDFSFAFNI